jgi:hypothetical protein
MSDFRFKRLLVCSLGVTTALTPASCKTQSPPSPAATVSAPVVPVPAARDKLIYDAPRSKWQPCLFEFELDEGTTCEVHSDQLTRVRIPAFPPGIVELPESCVLVDAPHGRIAVTCEGHNNPRYERIDLNRCERCTEMTEKHFGVTRQDAERNYVETMKLFETDPNKRWFTK